jgi:meso-butanediol dehydrogenase/(S,S)-butanediol dehydrogenase/diacetyl reductase
MRERNGLSVIVTGACGGIGEAVARRFATAGAGVALADVRAAELAKLAAKLTDDGAAVYHEVVDVSDDEAVQAFCASAARALGSVSQLVNTVGSVDNMGDVVELTLDVWERALRVNLTSAFLLARHAVPLMIDAGGGAIVNVASVSAMANQARMMAYSVTKAGMLALTRSEAIDLARHGIRANSICPGSVETPLVEQAIHLMAADTDRSYHETRRDWESQYPTGRFSQPDEVAELALFLCSQRAANITGASFVIDGGLTALLPER